MMLSINNNDLLNNCDIFVRYNHLKTVELRPQLAYRGCALKLLDPSIGGLSVIHRIIFKLLVSVGFYKIDQETIDNLTKKCITHIHHLVPVDHRDAESQTDNTQELEQLREENTQLRQKINSMTEKGPETDDPVSSEEVEGLIARLESVNQSLEKYRNVFHKMEESWQFDRANYEQQIKFLKIDKDKLQEQVKSLQREHSTSETQGDGSLYSLV